MPKDIPELKAKEPEKEVNWVEVDVTDEQGYPVYTSN